ncbi:MAG: hypothetical protein WC815_16555 [Vicinamibacterales bacterium]|jgi:hypothetical protein
MTFRTHALRAGVVMLVAATPGWAQSPPPKPDARVSFYVTTTRRSPDGGDSSNAFDFATAFTFRTPDVEGSGLEAGVDVRHTGYSASERPDRVSLYDGYVGARLGDRGQFRIRAGHMWLPDLGTAGSLAGGLAEYRSAAAGAERRLIAGGFAGTEPLGYQTGYADGVTKFGGYVGLESGFLRRHVVGFTNIRHGSLTERSMLSVTNYIPVGTSFFAYQALEYDLTGPADGAAKGGLSYFLMNARASAGPKVELQGTYNRGRALDARQLADDVINGRALSATAVDGLRYESAGGRISVKVAPRVEIYGGYARDKNNRDDATTGRLTVGGYASNLFGTGFDLSGSDARIDRPTGPYHSRYLSIGHTIGRSVYVAGDYSTSLAVVRFLRSDGLVIESRPWTRRLSANVSATINRQFSVMGNVDYTMDEGLHELRVMTGITYRMR